MNIHVIIDFQYNYYRHKYSIESGRINKLSAVVDGEVMDTTYIYHTLADIESHRLQYSINKDGSDNNMVVSICMDNKSNRLKQSDDYKSNRPSSKLNTDDHLNLDRIKDALRVAGYNIYSEEGLEADDLIKSLVDKYKADFDLTFIYTNDSDILVNLDREGGVFIERYKSSAKKHQLFTQANMATLMSAEFKCNMRDNTVILYKSLVGDTSDVIKGVTGFGKKAFDKYISFLENDLGLEESDFAALKDWENVEKVLLKSKGYLGEFAVGQALECLNLVKCADATVTEVRPEKTDSKETRRIAYEKYAMASLIRD